MNTPQLAALVVLWPLTMVAQAAPEVPPNPREQLETALPEALRLLQAKDYATLLKNFVVPDELKEVLGSVSLEDFAKKFEEDKAAQMIQRLKAVGDAKPVMSPDGKTGTYQLREEVGGIKSITWVKIEKYWYIKH